MPASRYGPPDAPKIPNTLKADPGSPVYICPGCLVPAGVVRRREAALLERKTGLIWRPLRLQPAGNGHSCLIRYATLVGGPEASNAALRTVDCACPTCAQKGARGGWAGRCGA